MDNEKVIIGIADMKIAVNTGMLVTYALGSCIGVCLYDATVHAAGMVHIMLPNNTDANGTSPLKYADTGIRETLKQMEIRGARRGRMTAKIAGGARMFVIANSGGLGNIGERNIESVRNVLRQENIRLVAEDVGGTIARTLFFEAASGYGVVRSYGRPERII